jgi:hypothetical protein
LATPAEFAAKPGRRVDDREAPRNHVDRLYFLHRFDDAGAIRSSLVIEADTVAGALKQVVDRVDQSERANYELWLGSTKVASIEATGNPRPVRPQTRTSWLKGLLRR